MTISSHQTADHTFDKLITTLRQGAVDAPGWHLTSAQRWRLLRDTLLGHVKVRGAIRPRDLPLDKSCQNVIDSSITFLKLQPYKFENAQILFRHWFAVFSLLPLATSQACKRCPSAEDDLLCATILELCFATTGRVLQDASDVATRSFVQRLIGVLGLSQQEWQRLVRRYQDGVSDRDRRPPHDAVLARWAARVIALPDPPKPEDFQSRDSWRAALADKLTKFDGKKPEIQTALAALDERACRYVTLKAVRPQRYINRGTRHWLLRGASGWCSQSLALARDLMCDEESLLFSDSDAIVGMWFPRDASESELRERLDARMAGFWRLARDDGDMARRFPRLAEWLSQSLPDGVGLDRNAHVPRVSLWCRNPLTVLEICLHRMPNEQPGQTPAADELPASGSCSRVTGDIAVSFRAEPPWLQDENDGEASPVGITSMVWALCGTAFRTHAHEGLCTAMQRPDLHLQAVKHGDWLQQLGLRDDSLVHLKLDGDGVGKRFRESSVTDFPWLSMQLARMVQHRLVAGVRNAIDKWPRDAAKGEPTLPVDVVYVGGDDVYVILPERMVEPFLEGFGGAVTDDKDDPWKDTSFTFVAARLKPKSDLLAGVEPPKSGVGSARSNRFAAANLAAARLVTEGLDSVKRDFRGEAPLDTNALQDKIDASLVTSHLADHGMTATVELKPMECGRDVGGGRRLVRGRVFVVGPRAAND